MSSGIKYNFSRLPEISYVPSQIEEFGSEIFPNMDVYENKEISIAETFQPLAELDLRGVICPYNFVKTKLKLEGMLPGEVLAVILDVGEPIRNVPQSIKNEGHDVLRQEPFEGAFRIFIRKQNEL